VVVASAELAPAGVDKHIGLAAELAALPVLASCWNIAAAAAVASAGRQHIAAEEAAGGTEPENKPAVPELAGNFGPDAAVEEEPDQN